MVNANALKQLCKNAGAAGINIANDGGIAHSDNVIFGTLTYQEQFDNFAFAARPAFFKSNFNGCTGTSGTWSQVTGFIACGVLYGSAGFTNRG